MFFILVIRYVCTISFFVISFGFVMQLDQYRGEKEILYIFPHRSVNAVNLSSMLVLF
jgi:hypothetical protein